MAVQCNGNPNSSGVGSSGSSAPQHAQLTREQIRSIFLSAAIPMVGFGFMDNFIMITAGSAIDNSLGVHMGLATMTAAAIGQVVSDVSGVLFGDTLSRVFKVSRAKLTAAQKNLAVVRRVRLTGAVLGVVAGCTLGACALYLIPDGKDESATALVPSSSSLSPESQQERTRDQLQRLQHVMNDVMTSEDDKWHDRCASCTLYVNESMSYCIPESPQSFFGTSQKPATIDRLSDSDDPKVLHTLKEGRVVVFADTIYVPVLGEDGANKSKNSENILGVFKIKLENGSFYTGSEIKDAKRVARNLGFFLNHMM